MPLKAGNRQGMADWPMLPAMQPLAFEVTETPKAEQKTYGGQAYDVVRIHLMVVEGPYSLCEPKGQFVWKPRLGMGRNPQTGQKSALRQFAEAIYGPLSDEEAGELDLEQMKGQRVIGVVNYRPDQDPERRPYPNPIGWSRYAPGVALGVPTGSPAAANGQPAASPPPVPPPPPSGPPVQPATLVAQQWSPDGQYGWDGTAWRPAADFAAPAAPPAPPPPPPGAPPPSPPGASARPALNF